MHVRDALEELATGAVRRIAAALGLPFDDAATRAALIDALALRLADPVYLREQVAALEPDERAALLAARAVGGEVRGFLLDRDQPGAAAALVERGLLFRTFSAAGPRRGEVFALADELFDVLPAPPADEPPPTDAAGSAPPERRTSDPAFSLFALASCLQRPGADADAELHGWSEEPGGWPPARRWTFFRHVGVASGLLVVPGHAPADLSRAHTALTIGPGLTRLLNDPPRAAERLWRNYLELRGWSELAEITSGVDHGAERPEDMADAALVRAAIVDAVEQRLPEGAWIEMDAFSEWLRETSPDVLREQLDPRGRLLLESLDWAELEAPLVRFIVLGPLYWLGRVATTVDGQRFARRPAPLAPQAEPCRWEAEEGAATGQPEFSAPASATGRPEFSAPASAAGRPESSSPTSPTGRPEFSASASATGQTEFSAAASATGQPAFSAPASATGRPELFTPASATGGQELGPEVSTPARATGRPELVAPARAELGTLLDAERYLVLEERGRWSRYRLVQQHVAAALGSGGSIEECRRLLRKLTQGPLPEHIEERLAAWMERFGALTVRPSVLVEARSEAELDAALSEETVKPFVRHRLGPTAAEVTAADALELAAALRESGHLPRVDAALRLSSEPRRTYPGLVDEQVLEFLLVSLLAFQQARPERLAELEGAPSLVDRLARQFPPERLRELRAAADRLAGELRSSAAAGSPPPAKPKRRARHRPMPSRRTPR